METSIAIDKKEIPCEYKKIDIYELKFHPKNPRIASVLENFGDLTEEAIDKELWGRNPTHQLKQNIEEHGGLQHPVIVYEGRVIEGNTRLCCYRHLYKEHNNEQWRYIDCRVLGGEVTDRQINALLGNEHIVGKIKWETYEKGYWMTMMLERDQYGWDELQKIVGQGKPWIESHIAAYKAMKKEKIEDKSKFSHFVQLKSNTKIKNIKNTSDPNIEEKIIEAIKNDQITEAVDIRKIPAICKDKNSKKRLFEYGEEVQQVFHDLKATKPTLDSPFIRLVEDLDTKTKKMKRVERDDLSESKRSKSKIRALTKELLNLCDELGIDLQIPRKIRKR